MSSRSPLSQNIGDPIKQESPTPRLRTLTGLWPMRTGLRKQRARTQSMLICTCTGIRLCTWNHSLPLMLPLLLLVLGGRKVGDHCYKILSSLIEWSCNSNRTGNYYQEYYINIQLQGLKSYFRPRISATERGWNTNGLFKLISLCCLLICFQSIIK